MTTAKADLTIDTSQLVDGPTETANATDVTVPLNELLAHLKSGQVAVSSNDTHVKSLSEALTVSGSGITATEQDDGADETLQLALATKLEQLLALLATGGKVPVGGIDSTGASNGDVLTANGSGGASFASAGGGGAQPIDLTGTAGEDLALRDFVFLNESDGEWYKIDIDADPIACGPLRGCVNEAGGITENSTGSIRILGEVDGFTGLTAWDRVWASTTAGSYTQTKPEPSLGGGQVVIAEMGRATSTTTLLIQPRPVQYMIANTLADDGTFTIKHHTDAQGRERDVRLYLASESAGASLASYSDSNQDSDVALRDRSPATYTADQCAGGTASASSNNGSFPVSNAFDDDNGTEWVAANSGVTSGWVEYDFGTSKSIRQYTITTRGGGNYDGTWDDWDLEYYNGSSWVIIDSDTHTWTSNNEKQTYQVDTPASADRWRINGSESGTNWLGVAEIEMMEVATYNDGPDKLAQGFQSSGASDVATVRLWLKKVGSPTGDLTLSIQTDSSGDPSGTPVTNGTSDTVSASTLSTSYGWIEFTFSTNPTLSASTQYHLVLSTSDSADEADYVLWGADGSTPSYADGEGKSESSSVWSSESVDFIFEVNAPGVAYDSPALVDDWETALAVFAARFDDGSGSNADTQTTVKNKTGVSKDVIAIVEMH